MARMIRRMAIQNFMNPKFGLRDRPLQEWKKIVDFNVYGLTEEEKNGDPDYDKRNGGLRLLGACKSATCQSCKGSGLSNGSQEDIEIHMEKYEKRKYMAEKNGQPTPPLPDYKFCGSCGGMKQQIVDRYYKPWFILDGHGDIVTEMNWLLENPREFVNATLVRTRVLEPTHLFQYKHLHVPPVGFAEILNKNSSDAKARELLQTKFEEKYGVKLDNIEFFPDKILLHSSSLAICKVSGINHTSDDQKKVIFLN
jgi:hypothetical protein